MSQQFGEIEASRIEKYLKSLDGMNSQFTQAKGVEGVKSLYKANLDEVIELCLNRVAPNSESITLKSVKMGLGVNKSTHTDVKRRRANEDLFNNIALLGESGSSCDK